MPRIRPAAARTARGLSPTSPWLPVPHAGARGNGLLRRLCLQQGLTAGWATKRSRVPRRGQFVGVVRRALLVAYASYCEEAHRKNDELFTTGEIMSLWKDLKALQYLDILVCGLHFH